MSSVNPKLITQAEYSRHRGCSRPAVLRAVQAGRITVFGLDKLIDATLADAQWARNTRARVSSKPAAPPDTAAPEAAPQEVSYQEARRREAVASALIREREAALQAGELIRLSTVRDVLGRHLTAAREIAMSCASRLAPVVAVETDAGKVHSLINAEMHRMLEEMASGDANLARPQP